GGDPLLVAAARRAVLDEYEAACRSVGLEPGFGEVAALVLVSAAFGRRSAADRLRLNWDAGSAPTGLPRAERPLPVRRHAAEGTVKPLNLASRPFRTETLPDLLLGMAAVAVVALTVAHGLMLRRLHSTAASERQREATALESELARLQSEARNLRPPRTSAET